MRLHPPALAAAVLLAFGVARASATTAPKPTLRISDASPLALSGTGFRTRESVRLRLSTTSWKSSRKVRAGARGSFRAVFASVNLDRCSGLRVDAVGARGSRAKLTLLRIDVCGDD